MTHSVHVDRSGSVSTGSVSGSAGLVAGYGGPDSGPVGSVSGSAGLVLGHGGSGVGPVASVSGSAGLVAGYGGLDSGSPGWMSSSGASSSGGSGSSGAVAGRATSGGCAANVRAIALSAGAVRDHPVGWVPFWMLVLVLALMLMGILAGEVSAQERDRLMDRIVAVVGEDVITERELASRVELTRQQLAQRGAAPPGRNVLIRQVLERMVLERIQLQEAKRVGITIDEATLNRAMEDIARENNLNLLQLRSALLAEGVDYGAFREQIRDELTIAQLRRRQVDSRLRVSEQEIDDLIAAESGAIDRGVRYRLAQILVALPQGADAATIGTARAKAEELLARARAGEDFAQLALQYSEAPDALEGGDLGWRDAGEIPTVFARAVILLRPGELSPILRSPSGFHVLKLLERAGTQIEAVVQIRARHILISPSRVITDEEALRQATQLYRRIQEGASFEDLARIHSNDAGSANRGGELGWLSQGETVPEFEAALMRLPIGQLSEPLQTQFGWHLIEVQERRRVDTSRELLRARAREVLQNRKREEESELWLRRLRDEAFVEYRIPGLVP